MEILPHLPAGMHRHIFRQKMIQRADQPFTRNGMVSFHADAIFIGVDAGIRAAAPFDIGKRAQHLLQRILKDFLHRHSILLNLPAMVAFSIITDCE